MTRRAVAVAVLAVSLLGACGGDGELAFRRDDRVEILQPKDEQEVRLPVRLRWKADLGGRADGGRYFAVFVDRQPVAPGQSLATLADESCDRTPGCPDREYLEDRYVFVTDKTALDLDVVPQPSSSQRTGARDRHEAVIVLIDGEGRRVGEASYRVSFGIRQA